MRVAEALIGKIEKGIVSQGWQVDGTADGSAKLVLAERGLLIARQKEGVAGVEGVVAEVLPRGAVELVAAGLGYYVHHAAKNRAEFSGICMGNDFELLNGVDDWRHRVGTKKSRKVIRSVGQEVIAAVGCAIDRGERERRALCNRGCKTSAASAHVILRDADRRDAGR